jgi:hypothetical protein
LAERGEKKRENETGFQNNNGINNCSGLTFGVASHTKKSHDNDDFQALA